MSKQTPTVEWIVAESEADWDRLCVSSIPDLAPPANKRMNRNRRRWVVGTLLLLLMSVSGWWSHGKQNAWPQPAVDAGVTPPLAPGASRADRRSLVDTIIGDEMTQEWRHQFKQEGNNGHAGPANPLANRPAAPIGIEITKIETLGDRVVVNIITTAKLGDPAFRQTRFYQHTAAGWLRTEPDAALWGAERTLETPYFVYHFREHDAPAVRVVAPRLDALYTTLHRNFGLLLTPGVAKRVIDVRVTQAPGDALPWFDVAGDPFIVASPARYLVPVTLTDVALLEQTLALPLLAAVLTRASQQYGIQESRQAMLSALRLWHVWEMELPLAAWREEIVQWLYADLTVATPERPVVLPQHYTDLCLAHKLWLWAPAQLGIPLACTDLDRDSWSFSAWGPHDPPLHLQQIALQAPPEEANPVSSHRGQRVALATLIAYTVATYGRETLPVLVAGLGRYESWETLIPAVYGVSAPEFEAGWQAYLATQYGVSLETLLHQ
jgi:hypothetical protein